MFPARFELAVLSPSFGGRWPIQLTDGNMEIETARREVETSEPSQGLGRRPQRPPGARQRDASAPHLTYKSEQRFQGTRRRRTRFRARNPQCGLALLDGEHMPNRTAISGFVARHSFQLSYAPMLTCREVETTRPPEPFGAGGLIIGSGCGPVTLEIPRPGTRLAVVDPGLLGRAHDHRPHARRRVGPGFVLGLRRHGRFTSGGKSATGESVTRDAGGVKKIS